MIKKDVFYLFVSLFFLNVVALAQDVQKEPQPLIEVLKSVEEGFVTPAAAAEKLLLVLDRPTG